MVLFFQLIPSCFNYICSRNVPFSHDVLIPDTESFVYVRNKSINDLKKCIDILIILKYITVLVSTRK